MTDSAILLGVIGRPHGVRGHVHVHSYAARPEDLSAYGPLADAAGRRFALRWVAAGVAEVSEIAAGAARPIADRAEAERLVNTRLFIARAALPPPAVDEFYLADLIGLAATDAKGAAIGTVAAVHDYGAGASLEITAEHGPLLIPFTRAAVPDVDVAARRLVVCPPTELIAEDAMAAAR